MESVRKTESGCNGRVPRELEAALCGQKTYWFGPAGKGVPKITLRFTITSMGPDFGGEIEAHYRLARFDKRGRCYAGSRADIQRDLGRVFPDYEGKKSRAIPISRLKNVPVRLATRWVTKDHAGRPLPEQQQYEVVDWIKGAA